MERLTRKKDKYPCRIKNCEIEEWILNDYDKEMSGCICDSCPIMPIVNRLAEYEDIAEKAENVIKDLLERMK